MVDVQFRSTRPSFRIGRSRRADTECNGPIEKEIEREREAETQLAVVPLGVEKIRKNPRN